MTWLCFPCLIGRWVANYRKSCDCVIDDEDDVFASLPPLPTRGDLQNPLFTSAITSIPSLLPTLLRPKKDTSATEPDQERSQSRGTTLFSQMAPSSERDLPTSSDSEFPTTAHHTHAEETRRTHKSSRSFSISIPSLRPALESIRSLSPRRSRLRESSSNVKSSGTLYCAHQSHPSNSFGTMTVRSDPGSVPQQFSFSKFSPQSSFSLSSAAESFPVLSSDTLSFPPPPLELSAPFDVAPVSTVEMAVKRFEQESCLTNESSGVNGHFPSPASPISPLGASSIKNKVRLHVFNPNDPCTVSVDHGSNITLPPPPPSSLLQSGDPATGLVKVKMRKPSFRPPLPPPPPPEQINTSSHENGESEPLEPVTNPKVTTSHTATPVSRAGTDPVARQPHKIRRAQHTSKTPSISFASSIEESEDSDAVSPMSSPLLASAGTSTSKSVRPLSLGSSRSKASHGDTKPPVVTPSGAHMRAISSTPNSIKSFSGLSPVSRKGVYFCALALNVLQYHQVCVPKAILGNPKK